MTKSRTVKWLFIFAGTVWLIAGIRDLLAPGFFSINGRTVTVTGIVIDFALGIFFLLMTGTVTRQFAERGKRPGKEWHLTTACSRWTHNSVQEMTTTESENLETPRLYLRAIEDRILESKDKTISLDDFGSIRQRILVRGRT